MTTGASSSRVAGAGGWTARSASARLTPAAATTTPAVSASSGRARNTGQASAGRSATYGNAMLK